MSKITHFQSKEDIQEEACLWISRIDRGCSVQEKQDMKVWVNQSNSHYKILMDMASLWDDLTVLNELSELFPLENTSSKSKRLFQRFSIAASLFLVVLVGGSITADINYLPLFSYNEKTPHEVNVLSTKVGEQSVFSMSDGTSIQLNTNSIVEVNYSEDKRQLKLIQGEAKFDVAKDKTRPFTVSVGQKYFTALGTIFNIQKNTDENLELLVTEGKVLITKSLERIESVTKKAGILAMEELPGILVESGEKAIIDNSHLTPVTKISLVEVQRDLAWQQGMLIFEGEPLVNALKEISRYSNIKFEILDEKLSHIIIAGYFKANDIEGLLKSLNVNFNIYHQKNSNNSIRLSSKEFHAS